MSIRLPLRAVILAFAATSATALAQQAPDPLKPLLQKLASNDFAQREAAQHDLDALSPDQMEVLEPLAAAQTDPEVKSRLMARVQTMAIQRLATQTISAKAHITGRLLDKQNRPIPNAWIEARTSSMGDQFWTAFHVPAYSDKDGRFDIPVPYSDILYQLAFQAQGHVDLSRKIMPETAANGTLGDLILDDAKGAAITGLLLDDNGKPVANQEVILHGEWDRTARATSAADGTFQWINFMGSTTNAIPTTTVGDLVASQIRMAYDQKNVTVTLAKRGTITGVVRAADGKTPIPGAHITAAGFTVNYETDADNDGKYTLSVPPGSYPILAAKAGYMLIPPREYISDLKPVVVKAGAATTSDVELERAAIVTGQILDHNGKPLEGALVAMLSTVVGDNRQEWRYAATNALGTYVLATGHHRGPIELVAYSSAEGLNVVRLDELKLGELRLAAPLQLPGSVRIAGTVTDAAGKGIKEVQCAAFGVTNVAMLSEAGGAFDLGRVSLMYARGISGLNFTPPQPNMVVNDLFSMVTRVESPLVRQVDSLETAPPFFLSASLPFDGKPGDVMHPKVTLEPAALAEFTGMLKDETGKPIAGATVEMLSPNSTEGNWLMQLHSERMIITNANSMIKMEDYVSKLGAARTDANGRWSIFKVVHEGTLATGGMESLSAKFCVGTFISQTQHYFSRDLQVPKRAGKMEIAFPPPK